MGPQEACECRLGPDGKPAFQRTKKVGDAPLGQERLRPPPPSGMESERPAQPQDGPADFPYPGLLGGHNQSAELMRGARLGGREQYDPSKPVAQGDLADMFDIECAARFSLVVCIVAATPPRALQQLCSLCRSSCHRLCGARAQSATGWKHVLRRHVLCVCAISPPVRIRAL